MPPHLFRCLVLIALCLGTRVADAAEETGFSPESDLLSLHYDHAPDQDDGHIAAADRTILQTLFGTDWIKKHVVAVSGACGKNADLFNTGSDAVMDAAWNDCGGWLAAHSDHKRAVEELTRRWANTLKQGGDIWVKEGGQSDITAEVVKTLRREIPDFDTRKRVHVVQHSKWNEDQTTDAALAFTKQHTHYIKIPDANNYLNIEKGQGSFVEVARSHPIYGPAWRAAFDYYDPSKRLDFSDTGELLHILGLGRIGVDAVKDRFLQSGADSE